MVVLGIEQGVQRLLPCNPAVVGLHPSKQTWLSAADGEMRAETLYANSKMKELMALAAGLLTNSAATHLPIDYEQCCNCQGLYETGDVLQFAFLGRLRPRRLIRLISSGGRPKPPRHPSTETSPLLALFEPRPVRLEALLLRALVNRERFVALKERSPLVRQQTKDVR